MPEESWVFLGKEPGQMYEWRVIRIEKVYEMLHSWKIFSVLPVPLDYFLYHPLAPAATY